MLSVELRRRYNFPLTGPTGLTRGEEAFVGSGVPDAEQTARNVAGHIQGKAAEKRFMAAWADKAHYPKGLVSVRRANRKEDDDGVDAFMLLTNGFEAKIQIKSSRNTYRKAGFERHARAGIVLVMVLMSDSHDVIRQRTVQAMLKYNEIVGRPQ